MSSFQTYHTKRSIISENCLWIVDGSRHICVTYVYYVTTGVINYAASVLKIEHSSPTEQQINGHELTTTRRFNIRRANANIGTYLTYDNILKQIRREMCHGQGCVGLRQKARRGDDEQSLSSVEGMSDGGDSATGLIDPNIDDLIIKMSPFKLVKTLKYSCIVDEPHGDDPFTIRTYYIAFKGMDISGDAMYGACLAHRGCNSKDEYTEPMLDDDGHYETAMMRMEKCPVYIKIDCEFKSQLHRDSKHCEDVMYSIIDKINKRVGGFMQIKGSRLLGYFN